MPSSFIPQRIKRAKQQITVKLYQDQLAMLDKYGRFIDDSRDYIISQALELVFKRDKEFARWVEQQRNAGSNAERIVTRTESAGSASLLWTTAGGEREASSHRSRGRDAKRIGIANGGSSREASGREPKSSELCGEYSRGSVSVSQLAVSG